MRKSIGADDPVGRNEMVVGLWLLLLPLTRAAALELEIGARFPAEPNEKIVVKNDGGVSNATDSFAFGEVWYSSDHLKTWFVMLRIVGDQVLVGFECIPAVFGRSEQTR